MSFDLAPLLFLAFCLLMIYALRHDDS